jgi:uncharacterized membrane protein (Fun14 family)
MTDARMTHFAMNMSEIQLINLSVLKNEKLIKLSEAVEESFFDFNESILTYLPSSSSFMSSLSTILSIFFFFE